MFRAGLGLCFLIGCWAGATAKECDINANGTSTCAGSDQTTLLQSRVQVSLDDTDSLSSEALVEHVYGPFKHDKSMLDYFKHLHQNAIDARLAKIIPDDGDDDDDELQVIFSDGPGDESFLEAGSDLESDIQALSAVSASELLQAEIEDECPHKAALLIEQSEQMEYEVMHAETADTQGVRHTLLKGKNGQLQYIASSSVRGEHRTLIADPPACSAGPLAALQTEGVPAPTGVISANDPVDAEMSKETREAGGEGHLLALDDRSVVDCMTLFKRTVAENCNNKQLDVKVLRAKLRIIDGFDVKMDVQVCKAGTQECHPHRPECAFETSSDHTDAKLLQFPQSSQTVPPTIQAEKDGLQATLKLNCAVCDVDARDGTTLAETEDNALLMEFQMGENSRYKGFEHVDDKYPDWSGLDLGLDALPAEVDFRKKYPKCYPALPSKGAGTETVRNQGTCGSCWAFASATTAMTNLCISGSSKHAMFQTNDRLEVSVQKILSCDGAQGQGCNGGNMGGFDAGASKWGLTKERDNIYKCGGGDPKKHFASKSDCKSFPWGGTCVGNANPDWWWRGGARVDGEQKMKELLAKGLALYVTMDVYNNFMSLRSGIYSGTSGGKMGGHAMSALGYGAGPEKDSSGKLMPYWIIQNSWGTRSWGVHGIGRIIRGRHGLKGIAGLEERAKTAAAWVTGGTKPPCEDSTSGSGLSRTGRPPFIPCSHSAVKSYCGRSTVMASCPKTCGQCTGFNGAGTKPGPQPTPAPKPPSPPGQGKCCRGSCSSHSDCGSNLFCCPGHKMCMDKSTKSTAGPNCNICRNGGRPSPTPKPAPTPSPSGPTKAPSAGAKTCGFEQSAQPYCGLWKNVPGDKLDWKRNYRTPSRGTGPDKAKTGRYFLYIETSGRLRTGDNAILEATTGILGSGASLNFAYSMNGRYIGKLKVKVNGKELFKEEGNKGGAWKSTSLDLGKYAGSQVKLQIEAFRGRSWSGDIAIDDVTLDEGLSATSPPPTTTLSPTPAPTLAPSTAAPTLAPTTTAPNSVPTTAPNSASSVFNRVDLDNNNAISRDELKKAIDSSVITQTSR